MAEYLSQRHRCNSCALALAALLLAALSATAQGPTPHAVTLAWQWTQGAGGASTGFKVYRGTVAGGPYTLRATLTDPAVRTFEDLEAASNPLIEGQRYFYVLGTTGVGGSESAPSIETNALIPFLPQKATLSVSSVR